jgi:ferrous iron transport protein A
MTLDELKKGEFAIIESLLSSSHKLKLVEMGIFKGRQIESIQEAPFRDPICYRVNNSKIMLRNEEAKSIVVRKCENPLI